MRNCKAVKICKPVISNERLLLSLPSITSTAYLLVAVHCHAVRVAAELPVGSRADGPAAATSVGTALLQSQQLLGTEGLVVSLGSSLNEILQVCSEKEVAEVNKLAVLLILDIDDTPPVLTAANLLPVDDDVLLRADNGKRNMALLSVSISTNEDMPTGCHKP
jgi:hypothetical protein